MKSYYCKRLYEEINFDAENIYVCCGMSLGPSFKIYDRHKNLQSYLKDLLIWRKSITESACRGIISSECKNCIQLEVREISFIKYILDKFKNKNLFQLKNIIIKSFRQCEFSCAYCLEKKYTKGKKTTKIEKSEFYDFLPIFKELIKNNMIDKNEVRLEFQGGSISVWDEFKEVLSFAVDCGIKHFYFHTNALTYIPEIAEISKNGLDAGMSISIDSGCAETFNKVKTEDKFNVVIDNIEKYVNAGISCNIKYIIVENLNDNLEEIQKFCNLIKQISAKNNTGKVAMMLDIDFRKSLAVPDYNIPDNYVKLFSYAKDFCKKNNIPFGTQEFISNLLKKSQSGSKDAVYG